MRNNTHEEHQDVLADVAAQLKDAGYEVQLEPSAEALPFPLGTYQPDIVGRRDGGGVIVEVKTAESRAAVDSFVDVARLVKEVAGWRFLLVPGDRLRQHHLMDLIGLASAEQLHKRREAASALLASDMHAAALITAWSGLEGAIRRRAEDDGVPLVALSTPAILKQAYSQGLLSKEQFRALEDVQRVRNAVAHGFGEVGAADAAVRVLRILDDLLREDTRERQSAVAAL